MHLIAIGPLPNGRRKGRSAGGVGLHSAITVVACGGEPQIRKKKYPETEKPQSKQWLANGVWG